MGHVRNGKLRALAVTSAKRFAVLPDLPTVAESGVPGYSAVGWFGLFAPAGTPKELVAKISADANTVLKMPEVKQRMVVAGAEPSPDTPEQFAAFVKSEMDKWAKLMKDRGIVVQ
jgi:tripartite-type tricarboxylate transporter receptor subunit TctC